MSPSELIWFVDSINIWKDSSEWIEIKVNSKGGNQRRLLFETRIRMTSHESFRRWELFQCFLRKLQCWSRMFSAATLDDVSLCGWRGSNRNRDLCIFIDNNTILEIVAGWIIATKQQSSCLWRNIRVNVLFAHPRISFFLFTHNHSVFIILLFNGLLTICSALKCVVFDERSSRTWYHCRSVIRDSVELQDLERHKCEQRINYRQEKIMQDFHSSERKWTSYTRWESR